MPLLRKKVFEKHFEPDLRDDEEVFHCEITNEIFRDYRDFAERMFLCNSMVWTCTMTGKSNLTYQEALESERHAVQCLKGFPNELKLPIIYLASLTKRKIFSEMNDDIFTFIKERYFVGENIEASFTSNTWKDCHVMSVNAPSKEQYEDQLKANGEKSPSERNFIPASLYKYEIEHLDAEDKDISEMMIVDNTQLRRPKVSFSKDKVKLFLKQNIELDGNGVFVIKSEISDKYNLKNVLWKTIFDGPLPNFQPSKNIDKVVNRKKKQKQETLEKFLKTNGLDSKKYPKNANGNKESLEEKMRKRQEEFKIQKQLNIERKLTEKLKMKEERLKWTQYFKEWSMQKDDLELEDHVKLPVPAPVRCKVPLKYFGNVLSVLEFVHYFQKFLFTKKFFPSGFTLEVMERVLMEKSVAGPLTDLMHMLLTAIFNLQEEESNHYSTGTICLKDSQELNVSSTQNIDQATRLATYASKWSVQYQGVSLRRLPLYQLTVSEVLRLHLLSSGAIIGDTGARWRYAQRGGYSNEDDPGLHMRLHEAHILKALGCYNVIQLSIKDKIKIITCLMEQILSYADVRDLVEENGEKLRTATAELRRLRGADKKKEMEYNLEKLNKDGKNGALDKLEATHEKKHSEIRDQINKISKSIQEEQVLLGRDRTFRKYIKAVSVPGIFVNWEDELAGSCLDRITLQRPELVGANKEVLMTHVKNIYDSELKNETSTNENDKIKINGEASHVDQSKKDQCAELLLCTADPRNCPVHANKQKEAWSFFYDQEQLEDLLSALNERGEREGKLKDNIQTQQKELLSLVAKTPVMSLNPSVQKDGILLRVNGITTRKNERNDDANFGYPHDMSIDEVLENVMIENILEMEEKIHIGGLGTLKTKDREAWRNLLQNKDYEEFDKIEMLERTERKLKVKKQDSDTSRSSTPDVPDRDHKPEYKDPGQFLGPSIDLDSEDSADDSDKILLQSESTKKVINYLAKALNQVAQAVEPKYLKKPLGSVSSKTNKIKEQSDVLEKWEQSLLSSTSFSQVFLHYGTLDTCVLWSRSALKAKCRICKRQKDSENMLLCDSCNLGHHMYCLKPKLKAVPKGDWFCDKCEKEREQEQAKMGDSEPVKKKRKIFIEEDVEEEEDRNSGNDEIASANGGFESDVDEEESSERMMDVCKTCGSGGETVSCNRCDFNFHKECADPPLRRLPRAPWTCSSCLSKQKYEQRNKRKDHGYSSDSNDSFEMVNNRRPLRRDERKDDLPLHNAALQELLGDVMKHDAAWPFLRPVHQKEVPDYYEIIQTPMDFGTIKYKLNMGEYSTDSQLMRDVALIFSNCQVYNSSNDEVYKCGEQLLSYFSQKAKEFKLSLPPDLDDNDNAVKSSRNNKRKRII
ncbi:hypothetical protein ABEB36_008502 [Hypothenemus hampei]|uniref:Bromodomain adjacent to zinc finger domain protein 1A n=1 Tax=Hypothenemus hampei TaxID=57062 RepID=A0ABD1EM32_HYPHA